MSMWAGGALLMCSPHWRSRTEDPAWTGLGNKPRGGTRGAGSQPARQQPVHFTAAAQLSAGAPILAVPRPCRGLTLTLPTTSAPWKRPKLHRRLLEGGQQVCNYAIMQIGCCSPFMQDVEPLKATGQGRARSSRADGKFNTTSQPS